MKKNVLIDVFLFSCLSANMALSQPYGNEWINYSQQYYKIPVIQNGIYRIGYTELATAIGPTFSSIDPRRFQVFFRGAEQPLYIKGESDGVFDPGDFMEFYGQYNDGMLDSVLYKGQFYNQPARHPNPYYSLFSDTAMYFLTWNSSTNNKRLKDSVDLNFISYLPAPFFIRREIAEKHDRYYYGQATYTNIQFPEYHESEGWLSDPFYASSTSTGIYSLTLPTTNAYPGPNATVKLSVVGESNPIEPDDHKIRIQYKNASNTYSVLSDTIVFNSYLLVDSVFLIPASALGSSTEFLFTAHAGNFSYSTNAIGYVQLDYPHTPDLENNSYYEMLVPQNVVQNKTHFQFTNFNDMSQPVYLYDFENNLRILLTKNGGIFEVLVPNAPSGNSKFCVVKRDNIFNTVLSIKPVNGTGFFTDYKSLAFSQQLDSAFIIVTNKKLMNGAQQYAAYRSAINTGNHKTLIADIDELIDQYMYGIPKHPFSLRHFVDYALDSFPTPPKFLFLIGKGVEAEKCRNSSTNSSWGDYLINYNDILVPTLAYPTSDNMILAGVNGTLLEPPLALGRLAAKNNTEVSDYLTKVQEYEIAPLNEWRKEIIHISGGGSPAETALFDGYLKSYETIIEDTSYGGNVHVFSKSTSTPITPPVPAVKTLIDSGVGMITYFGHSAASIFAYGMLPPDQYINTNGKYPFFLALGCIVGNISIPPALGSSASEDFVLFPQRGTIAFLASSGPGTPGHMHLYASAFHQNLSYNLYGKPVGTIVQKTIQDIQGNGGDPFLNATCLELTLHGDPSLVIHSPPKPDYKISPSSIFFIPSTITTESDSFDVNVVVSNIGKAVPDSFTVWIQRTFPDGSTSSYTGFLSKVYYKDTLTLKIPMEAQKAMGVNKFEVKVDLVPADSVDEMDDLANNIVAGNDAVLVFILSGDILPVVPYEYAIVPHDTLTLKASTANPFEPVRTYIFEVDTTDLFNSPLKQTQYVTKSGGVVTAPFIVWPSVLADSVVCFWRVKRDTADTTFKWRESSFHYIPDKRGWSQSHFFQFTKGNQYDLINADKTKRQFEFLNPPYVIFIKTENYNAQVANQPGYQFTMNANIGGSNIILYYYLTRSSVVKIFVVDSIIGIAWPNDHWNYSNPVGPYGSDWHNHDPLSFEFVLDNPQSINNLISFIEDTIPCGSLVGIYTTGDHSLKSLLGSNPALLNAFYSVGATSASVNLLQDSIPYILIGTKCGSASEVVGDSVLDIISLQKTFNLKGSEGKIFSETIGPSSRWESLHWNYFPMENPSDDSITIYLLGTKINGATDTLGSFMPPSYDVYNLFNTINASVYPYLTLVANKKDVGKQTPPQLRYWRIYYDGMPEAALNPNITYSFYASSVQQGDSVKMNVAVQNISEYDMDSLWVDFWVVDANRVPGAKKSFKLDSLRVDSFIVAKVVFPTDNLPGGASSLWVEANPFNTEHQLEQYHFNNLGFLPFSIETDAINPLLDVTFDGIHIMNGDIVSAKPTIVIKVKDENQFLALNDKSDFDVFVKYPGKSVYEKINFGDTLSFEPAILPDNSCKIIYTPVYGDGIHFLKVQAKDRSGNLSGNSEYIISFEVINKPSITHILNYPNPFSTSTRFVFTLTGSEVPDYFKIQIMTVTGKVVREIQKYELGNLHIGKNITDYAWNGKDEFGDQLANGIYLYRVITQLNGKPLEHRQTAADDYFIKEFGKMYLMR